MKEVVVSMVQPPMHTSIQDNVHEILKGISESKKQGAGIAVFPECVVTGYHPNMGDEISFVNIEAALKQIADACAMNEIAAVIGSPCYENNDQEKPWNAAVVFDAKGQIVAAFPKIVFTPDEVRNDIYIPGPWESRTTFELGGITCAILICVEFAGLVGAFSSEDCYKFLDALSPKPEIVFVIGVMNLGPDSSAPGLASEVAEKLGSHLVVVNAAEWGFGVPGGSLGGSFVALPSGERVAVAPFNEPSVVVQTLTL